MQWQWGNGHKTKTVDKITVVDTSMKEYWKCLTWENARTVLQFLLQYWPLRSFKVNDFHVIWKPTCDLLLVINSNLGPISHRLATIHPWQTDERQLLTIARPLLKYGQLKMQIALWSEKYCNFKTIWNWASRSSQKLYGTKWQIKQLLTNM